MKLLTVVVPSYNSEKYLHTCIDSLIAGGERMEIIIIDDGSTDRTGEIADGYAKRCPSTVSVVHAENGGHGAGINRGLARATGKFFKVVDSDDRLTDLPAFLDLLENDASEADLIVTNYVYTYTDGSGDDERRYAKYFPKDRVFSWSETKKFKVNDFLMIHACTFRTEVVRNSGIELPERVFYEDNLYICSVLPYTERIFYSDTGLYRYTIGRAGQSVSEEAMTKRYKDNIYVARRAFCCCRHDELKKKNKKLDRLIFHEQRLLFGIASNFARRSNDPDAETLRKGMWKNAYAFDRKYARKLRHTFIWFLNIPGPFGKAVARAMYAIAHKIVKFN